MLVLIAQALGRDAGTGEKDENRGETLLGWGKPTTLSPFKAILQKERHHRTNRSFRQILFLGKSTGGIHPFMQSVVKWSLYLMNQWPPIRFNAL